VTEYNKLKQLYKKTHIAYVLYFALQAGKVETILKINLRANE